MSDTSSVVSEQKLKKLGNVNEKAADITFLEQLEHFSDGSFTAEDIEIIAAHLDDYSTEEALRIVSEAVEYHRGDTCMRVTYYLHLVALTEGPSKFQSEDEWETILKFDAFLIHDWSPYPEVRAITRPIDEEEFENYENIRVYLLSIIWSGAGSVLATFFAIRFPSISLSQVAVQILIAYTGKLLERIPDFSFPVGFGRRWHFGGGKWNFKEQMLATAGLSTGNTNPYSQYVILAMANNQFYGFKEAKGNFGFAILLTLSTNIMGFGISGLFRIFLIYPVRMIWYVTLPNIKLSRTLVADETRENVNGWKLKGWEFFWIFSIAEFLWYWVTDFLFQFLSTFDWVAWISHKDNDMLSIAGVQSGLGFNPIPSFDWSIFGATAMITPFFSTGIAFVGTFLSSFIIIGMWYSNVSYTSYLPINSNVLFDNTGHRFNVSAVLNDENTLDEQKYKNYSMPFWSAGSLVSYGAFFSFYPAMIMHALLNYTSILAYSFRIFFSTLIHPGRTLSRFDDRYSRAQRKYKEVPEWWYLLCLAICLGLGIATVEHYKFSNTPVWTIFFGIALSLIFMIPSGVLYATTNQQVIINVLYELIIGLTNEGNGSALMVSKAFATNFMDEADNFITNLKTGHYIGLSPRSLFRLQVVNCIANSFIQSGLMTWQSRDGAIKGMCTLTSPERFYCQGIRTYFNAAVQWGTIGPRRVLHDLYPRMRYTFLFGALVPIPFWAIRRFAVPYARSHNLGEVKEGASRFRNSLFVRSFLSLEWTTFLNELVLISGAIQWAPYNFMYTLPPVYVGFFFQWWLPRYYPQWWRKYNYLLYASISVGYSYSALIMFFSTQYTHIASVDWWGNDKGTSLSSSPRLEIPEGQIIGPQVWDKGK